MYLRNSPEETLGRSQAGPARIDTNFLGSIVRDQNARMVGVVVRTAKRGGCTVDVHERISVL